MILEVSGSIVMLAVLEKARVFRGSRFRILLLEVRGHMSLEALGLTIKPLVIKNPMGPRTTKQTKRGSLVGPIMRRIFPPKELFNSEAQDIHQALGHIYRKLKHRRQNQKKP
mmetsp:Transcript_1567/g.3575  ORF Transcript_1567/g.3575 Transcript_1567/m.3575 type:complete len:112 (-) Transcript_1567:38-373(-)